MATSGQTNNKVLLPLGPMIGNFKGKLSMLQEWTIRELVRASDEVFLLHVGKFPQSIESAADFVSGALCKEMMSWDLVEKEKQVLHINRETQRAERVLKEVQKLCKRKVDHVTLQVEWGDDVPSKVAEVAKAIGATCIVLGTDGRSKTFSIPRLGRKSRPTPEPVHVATLGSKVAALVHCNVYCISLTTGQLVRELKGEAPPLGDSLPRPDSASSGMSSENSSNGSSHGTPQPRPDGLQLSRSFPGEGPTSHSRHLQSASFSGHDSQPSAFYPVPFEHFRGPQFFPALVRSPGHTGPISSSPNFDSGYHYVAVPNGVSPGHMEASAPPLHPFQGSAPQFVLGNSPNGPAASGYGHNHLGGYVPGHVGGAVYPPGFVTAPGSGNPTVQRDGAHRSPGVGVNMPGFMAIPGSGLPVGQSGGPLYPAASPMESAEHSAERAAPNDVWRSNGQQPAQNQTVPVHEPAGATQERPLARELQSYEGYSLQELTQATKGFSQELGGGGFGTVYLGNLRGTQVAVKKMDPEGLQGPEQFECEVKLLTKLRHRNIVILMGCCPEAFCLVYEYCAQGSLETRLADDTRPLPWYTRVRIMLEIATAVLWMHKHDHIHCDIKLANMLLDESNTAKLGDVGISRMIPSPDARTARLTGALTSFRTTSSVRGSVGYVDPALFNVYPLKESSDIYALGVCLLQLLTKRPAGFVKREVKQAYLSKNMAGVLDRSAGDWPLETVVEDLTNLAFRCTEYDQDDRPDLELEIIPVLSRLNDLGKEVERQELEGLHRMAAELTALQAPGARPRDHSDIMESQFYCPISLRVMEDPVVAADGHTYERREIETWMARNRTSPVTGETLRNTNLVPNYSVKSACLEWTQRTGGQVEGD